jgi:hypothetical protein
MSKEHIMTETEKLAKAALAVCDRWDTPDWSDHRHTADFIRDLREALTAWNTRPDEGEPVAVAGTMPGASGFTMATFEAAKVPVGTPLYTRPAPALDRDGVARIIREHVKVDATGLAPAVVGHFILGFEDAADAILSLLASQEG